MTEQQKIDIDKQVRKNRFELKFAIFTLVPFSPLPMTSREFFPIEAFSPMHIVRKARDRVEAAMMAPVNNVLDFCDDAHEVYEIYKQEKELYKVCSDMSSTLSKFSDQARKDEETRKGLDKLTQQIKNGEGGRGAKKLAGTKDIWYARGGNKCRVFFKYSKTEKGVINIIAESNKNDEPSVIKNIKKNHK